MEETVRRLRFISTISSTFNVEDIYKLINAKYKTFNLTLHMFSVILKTYFKAVQRRLIEDGVAYYMPSGLGIIAITKTKTGIEWDANGNILKKTFYLDMEKTKALKGKKVHLMDIEYIMRLKWFKGIFKNKSLFYLNANKKIKSKLWEMANSNTRELSKYRNGK